MELYILSKEDLSIKSIIKPSDYEINLDEETNAKTTFILKKCDGLKEGNFIVVNGLYKQFLFVIPSGGITTEKGSNIVTVTALDISNIFDRKIIKKDTDLMTNNSIEEFLAKTISENFVNSDDPYLNIPYMLINWKTETKAVVDTNAENGLYNFHTFLINCRQYKNICTDFKFKEKIKESYRTAQGKKIEIQNGKKGTHLLITTKGETNQATRSGKNLFNLNNIRNAPSVFKVTDTGVNLTNDWAGDVFTFENIAKTFKANTTYTMKAKAKVVSRPSTIVNINDNIFTFYRPASDELRGVVQSILAMPDKRTIALNTEKEYITTFTTPEDMTNVRFLSYTFRGNNDGSTTGTALGEIDVSEIMLVEGSYTTETFPEYEKYGASPSPDYRSPIENVKGKNKFNKSNMTEATWDNGKTNTVTLLEDGTIQSTANFTQWAAKCIDIPNLKANTDYVASGKIVSSTAGNAMIIVKGYKNNTLSNIIYHQYSVGTRFELSFNSSDYEKIGISLSGSNNTLGTTYTTIFDEIQLEEGTVVTDYVPYNSLEIKDVGKQILNKNAVTFSNGASKTILNTGIRAVATVAGQYRYLAVELGREKLLGKEITFSTSIEASAENNGRMVAWFGNATSPAVKQLSIPLNETGKQQNTFQVPETFPTNCDRIWILFYCNFNGNANVGDYVDYTDSMVVIGDIVGEYEEYQEQKVTFPLSEGQKLYKGSYLASNGIHHKRTQVVLTGNEDWVLTSTNNQIITKRFSCRISPPIMKMNSQENALCSHFANVNDATEDIESIYYATLEGTTYIALRLNVNKATTVEQLKAYLSEQYSNGTPVTVEYELAEEEIIPYTEAQQEAWNKIEELMMFEGYNSIESNAQLDIKYNYIYPENAKLIIDIENKEDNIAIIDTTLAEVTDSNKIYEANYTAKVQVLIREDNSIYNLYLKTNRTTTENKDDPDRASGKVETISVDTADKAREEALNVMKGNTYKHLVEFKIPKTSKLIDITKLYIGRKVKIKTEDDIYDSYISAITLNDENFVYFKSGNLRIDLLDKLKKQKESVGNKLDVEGGTIKNLKIEKDLDINGNYYKNGEKIDTEMQIKAGEEYATNEYIDGKRVYIKQLEFNDIVGGGQDNRLVKSHGIVGAEKIWVDLSNSYIKATTTKATYPLPVILYSGNISALSVIVDLTNIYLEAQGGWGDIWTKVIRLKYTKEQEV